MPAKHRVVGPGLAKIEQKFKKGIRKHESYLYRSLREKWIRVVQGSVRHKGMRPASRHTLFLNRGHAVGSYTYGWQPYRGSGSQRRLSIRSRIFVPRAAESFREYLRRVAGG